MTLLFSGRCIFLRFFGNLRLDRPRLAPCRPLLLTAAVFHPLPRCRSSRLRLPLPLLPTGGRRGRGPRVRRPFRGPRAAPVAPEVNEKGPGKSPDGVAPLLRVGGLSVGAGSQLERVPGCYPSYRTVTASPSWTLPPLSHYPVLFPTYRAGSPLSLALRQEVEKMLSKDALEIILNPGPGFYSRLFLVEKVTGGWRPVIDLSHLNGFVRLTPFKMETVASVLLFIKEEDFLASIDLKDAYFQIPVHQSSRKLLRFLSEGTVYQFKALCFGLLTAPQVFTSVFTAVSAWTHSHGICLLWYLDDWLVLASSEAEAKRNAQDLLLLCHSLGIVINEGKSDLVPSQRQ